MQKPAILGGEPLRRRDYPTWPIWDEADRARLNTVLETLAWWDGDGDMARTFARRFAEFQGARHGLPMTNGTHTLEAALWACDIGDGDEVIVPAMTFIASATAVIAVEGHPDPRRRRPRDAQHRPRSGGGGDHRPDAGHHRRPRRRLCGRSRRPHGALHGPGHPPDRGLRPRPRHHLARAAASARGAVRVASRCSTPS